MPSSPSHNQLIKQAAKASLGSIGCRQKGQSRVWLDDHGWWVGLVEFQPSSWAKGSYLNVGATFLWRASGVLSFDFAVDDNCRKQGFHEFEDSAQFEHIAQRLSNQAVAEVTKLRSQLCSIQAASALLGKLPGSPVYCHYHAAVAAALAGDLDSARVQFAKLSQERGGPPWLGALQAKASRFADAMHSQSSFRELVTLEIQEAGQKVKLPLVQPGTDLWQSS